MCTVHQATSLSSLIVLRKAQATTTKKELYERKLVFHSRKLYENIFKNFMLIPEFLKQKKKK